MSMSQLGILRKFIKHRLGNLTNLAQFPGNLTNLAQFPGNFFHGLGKVIPTSY